LRGRSDVGGLVTRVDHHPRRLDVPGEFEEEFHRLHVAVRGADGFSEFIHDRNFVGRSLEGGFEDFQLLPDRTISENLTFVMKATGWSDGAKMKNRQAEVLMQVGLGAVEKKMPHQLSGGEQQRVVIARALINEPVLLIADEPTGNLDPEVSHGILKVFQQINKSGTAILMATHSYGLIKKFPARILKCEEGKLLDSRKESFELSAEL